MLRMVYSQSFRRSLRQGKEWSHEILSRHASMETQVPSRKYLHAEKRSHRTRRLRESEFFRRYQDLSRTNRCRTVCCTFYSFFPLVVSSPSISSTLKWRRVGHQAPSFEILSRSSQRNLDQSQAWYAFAERLLSPTE